MKTSKIDLQGQKFFKLTVLSDAGRNKSGAVLWLCECECGKKIKVPSDQLRGRKRKSCGCWREGVSQDPEYMVGRRFNHLVVIKPLERIGAQTYWLCECDCGKKSEVRGGNLISGNTRSCGCRRGKSHGLSHTPEYVVWDSMKARCLNKNNQAYAYYGGRGITICPQWIESFLQFYNDIGPRPNPTYSLDRVDSDGHYEPSNVRWATPSEQWNNRKQRSLTVKTYQNDVSDEYKILETHRDNVLDCTFGIVSAVGSLSEAVRDDLLLSRIKNDVINVQRHLSQLATLYDINLASLMQNDLNRIKGSND